MANPKRQPRFCIGDALAGCATKPPAQAPKRKGVVSRKAQKLLDHQGVIVDDEERDRFVEFLDRSIRQRSVVKQRWTTHGLKDSDIISLIMAARDAGDIDEAIWRCFLAAHFGRPSARGERQIQSASRFLCAFRKLPFWTWKRVSKNPEALREWLFECADDLDTLMYGNHRKYESQKPKYIWSVIESFVLLANAYGSPTDLTSIDVDDEVDGFDFIYRRLRPVKRFGRTGRFDFLVLLLDLGFITAEPRRPYLRGSTGPLVGAKLLWGEQSPKTLDDLAADLSAQLGVSPIVMEDALCNWQK